MGVGAFNTRRGHRVGRHRAEPARHRPRLGPPQEAALLGLRAVRVRRPHRRNAATAMTARWCASRRCGRACASSSSACDNMPEGAYKSDHPLATPPVKERTMHDIETLITHFLNVSWGPVMPPGEVLGAIENTKGTNGYYLVSDGSTQLLPHAHPHALVPAPADAAADLPRPHDPRPAGHSGRHGFSCWRMWTVEEHADARRTSARSKPNSRTTRTARRVSIDAMKIVQQHRGWVSDESLRDMAELLGMSRGGTGRRRDLLQPDLPQAGGAPRDPGLRQRELLDHGLRAAARAPVRSGWDRPGRDHGRRTASRCCPSSAWAAATARRP